MLSFVVVLLAVVLVNGLVVFWPASVAEATLTDGKKLLGKEIRSQVNPDTRESSVQFKTGNRELDPKRQDFRWVKQSEIASIAYPPEVLVLERMENGDFFGRLKRIEGPVAGVAGETHHVDLAQLRNALLAVRRESADTLDPLNAELKSLGHQLQEVRNELFAIRYRRDRLLAAEKDASTKGLDAKIAALESLSDRIKQQSDRLVDQQQEMLAGLRRNVAVLDNAAGREARVSLLDIVRVYAPNDMGLAAKCRHYAAKIGELLWENPRESNTEGGLFPAIFGTVMLIFLMALSCFPLGVLAGIYLGEYAKDGPLVRIVRVAVNNLAGIPSIVYGIFGLGFFVYGIGGFLDQWFFPERVAAGSPTFGTGGILWASLTLGLLTVPVVIVSTEEALRAIPSGIREGSFALGATKFQTLVRVLVPMASPGMLTGFILAMARAAGEVAPLMITGVVKLAPQMPVDGSFPFFHLDRKFMHLGFHIYDVGFQSPNVEASKPMVYVTTLLLLLIVLAMTSVAIWLRNRMRKRCQLRTI